MMYGYDMTTAGWIWMVGGWLALALAIVAGAWLVARGQRTSAVSPNVALELLKARFARGEISQEEFEQARRVLG